MGAAVLCFSNVFEWPKIERNLHAEINPALAYGHANTVKAEVAIFFAVTDHDIPAVTAHQLIQSHIVEVAAVAEIHIVAGIICACEQFVNQPQQSWPPLSRPVRGGHLAPGGHLRARRRASIENR